MDAVASLRNRRKADVRAPRCIYPCAHCAFRTDRLAAAWCHGLLHGYVRKG